MMRMAKSLWQSLGASSILQTSIVSMAMIAGCLGMTGCGEPIVPAELTQATVKRIDRIDPDTRSRLPWRTMEIKQTIQDGKSTVSGANWSETAPGVWTNSAQGITTHIKIEPAEDTTAPGTSMPLICHFSHYIGPSSAIDPTWVGEAAVGQLTCVSGKAKEYILVDVCSDMVPDCASDDAVGYASPGTPFTFGLAVPGTAGADCSGAVWDWGTRYSGSNPCG